MERKSEVPELLGERADAIRDAVRHLRSVCDEVFGPQPNKLDPYNAKLQELRPDATQQDSNKPAINETDEITHLDAVRAQVDLLTREKRDDQKAA